MQADPELTGANCPRLNPMLLDGFLHDLRYAFRTIRTSPGFAMVAILSLALGIGANTAIFSLIDAVILKYLPVSHPGELLQVRMGEQQTSFTNPLWEEIRNRQDVFSGAFAFGMPRFNLATGGEARYVQGSFASGGYFTTLGVHAVLGRTFTVDDDSRGCAGGAVLSYDFWQRQYGGSAAVVNQIISVDGHPFPVLGVAEPGFFGMTVGSSIDVYLPICAERIVRGENSALDRRSTWWLTIIGRPKPGVSPKQVEARLKTLAPSIYAATVPPNWGPSGVRDYLGGTFDVAPASSGTSSLRRQYQPALTALMAIVGVVLLIACANVANLLLARATVRRREIAIRMALGSGRARLVRQLLTESILLSACGAILGFFFAHWGSRLMIAIISTQRDHVFLDLTLDPRVLAFTAAVAIATGMLFGIAPAWQGTRVSPQSAMKENSRNAIGGRSRFGLGKTLVVLQVALSLVLLTGAALLVSTFRRLETMDPGFVPDRVLVMNIDLRNANMPQDRRGAFYLDVLDRLRAIPGVRSASASDNTPVSGSGWNDMIVVDGFVPRARRDSMAWFYAVYPKYFETLGIRMVAGRDFDDRDRAGSATVAIVNETFARKFLGSKNPLGKTYRTQGINDSLEAPVEIVGIVRDAKYRSLRDDIPPTVYVAKRQEAKTSPYGSFEMLAQSSAADLIPSVKAAMEQSNRDVTISFNTLSTQVADSLNRERLLAIISGFFGGLALLLACIGLYGVMSYNVVRRRGEIGIRMALGAQQRSVLNMVLGEVALLLVTGVIAGSAASLAATRMVDTFLYGVTSRDPLSLSIAGSVLLIVAGAAGYLPARRASRLDPMVALREE